VHGQTDKRKAKSTPKWTVVILLLLFYLVISFGAKASFSQLRINVSEVPQNVHES
jgi:hypothetical protein